MDSQKIKETKKKRSIFVYLIDGELQRWTPELV